MLAKWHRLHEILKLSPPLPHYYLSRDPKILLHACQAACTSLNPNISIHLPHDCLSRDLKILMHACQVATWKMAAMRFVCTLENRNPNVYLFMIALLWEPKGPLACVPNGTNQISLMPSTGYFSLGTPRVSFTYGAMPMLTKH